jgi:YVTN family beta-propeller protein
MVWRYGVLGAIIPLSLFWHQGFACGAPQIQLKIVDHAAIGNLGNTLALNPSETELYVAQPYNDTVAVVNTRSRKLTKVVPVGRNPVSLVVSPDGRIVFVGEWGGGLSSVDAATGTASRINVGGHVAGMAMTSDGRTMYLAMCESGIRKLDTRSGVVGTIYRGFCPWALALSPDQRSLWVNFQGEGPGGRAGHDTIAKIDLATGRLGATLTGLANVGGAIFVSRDGGTLWADGLDACVVHAYDHLGCPVVPAGIVHVIDAVTMKVSRSLPKVAGGTISVSPDCGLAALTGGRLVVSDARTLSPLATIDGQFYGAVFSADCSRLYAVSSMVPEITVIDIRRF